MKTLLISFLYLASLLFFSGCLSRYEIRGDSNHLDDNLTHFLHQWRHSVTAPIAEGKYQKIYLNHPSLKEKTLALTFDDSPDENNTGLILDILKHYQIKGTFFMIGSPMSEENATVTKRAFAEGHLVMNHSFTHPHFTKTETKKIVYELNATTQRIATLTGSYPILFRPPYGDIDPRVMDVIASEGYTTILWSLDSLDWVLKDKEAITQNVLTHVQNGDIILMHSGRSNRASVEALPQIIETLQKKGYRFERLDEMLGIQAYR